MKIYLFFGQIIDQDFAEDVKDTNDKRRETPLQIGKYQNMMNGYLMTFIFNLKPVPRRLVIDRLIARKAPRNALYKKLRNP